MISRGGREYKVYALIAAAGSSVRMGAAAGGVNKVYADLNGSPVIVHSVDKFRAAGFVDAAVAVVSQRDEALFGSIFGASPGGGPMPLYKAPGGAVRTASVFNGLKKIAEISGNGPETVGGIVMIHDGARPNFPDYMLKTALEELIDASTADPLAAGVVFASPSYDTLCRVGGDGFITGYEDRESVFRIATPQIFLMEKLIACFKKLESAGPGDAASFTDESALAVHFGFRVKILKAPAGNIKVTEPADLDYLRAIMKKKSGVQ